MNGQEFTSVKSFQNAYQQKSYEQYKNSPPTFSPEDILFYETTSGSSAAKKEIPYTRELIQSFTVMFKIWVYDILKYGPKLRLGRIYFSTSPQFIENSEINGNKDDTDFITGPLKWVLSLLSVTPTSLKKVTVPQDFFHILSLYLISNKKLEVISIWSPTFLLEVLNHIDHHKSALLQDLSTGVYRFKDLEFNFNRVPDKRLEEINTGQFSIALLFPNLKLISCWGSARANPSLERLKSIFSHITIQEKGLLATEGPFTLPIINSKSQLPLPSEVFYEFVSSQGEVRLLHELETGKIYDLIITQKSGLIRYQMNDQVMVDGLFANTPTFKFLGRTHEVSDLVGEKLSSSFVQRIFTAISSTQYIALVPTMPESNRPFYTVITNCSLNLEVLETELCLNPHYQNARLLNQLGKPQIVIHSKIERIVSDYYFNIKKIAYGDQKDRFLHYREYDGKLLEYLRSQIALLGD